jgi:hypothetical protein
MFSGGVSAALLSLSIFILGLFNLFISGHLSVFYDFCLSGGGRVRLTL